jgi:hypothetical protein
MKLTGVHLDVSNPLAFRREKLLPQLPPKVVSRRHIYKPSRLELLASEYIR